jgi:hypothetical protein
VGDTPPLRARLRSLPLLIPAYLFRPTTARHLAVFRIAVAAVVIGTTIEQWPVRYARLPDGLRTTLPGSGGLYELVEPTPNIVLGGTVVLLVTATSLLIGLGTRATALATGALGVYVLGVPQLYGKVDHYHHVVWFSFVVALGPSGAALAIDGWRRRGRTDKVSSARYGFPVAVGGLLVAAIYLVPGLAKIRTSRWRWFTTDNLANLVHYKSWELGAWNPPLHIENEALLFKGAALGLVLFELLFVVCLFVPRLRLPAVVAGVVFHVLSALTVGILFWSLLACYVLFLDESTLRGRRLDAGDGERPARAALAAAAVLVVLVLAPAIPVLIPGHHPHVIAWPFAAYPTFDGIQGTTAATGDVVAVVDGVESAPLDGGTLGGWMPAQRYRALVHSLLGGDIGRARAFAEAVLDADRLPEGTAELRFYRRTVNVVQGDDQGDVLEQTLVAMVPLACFEGCETSTPYDGPSDLDRLVTDRVADRSHRIGSAYEQVGRVHKSGYAFDPTGVLEPGQEARLTVSIEESFEGDAAGLFTQDQSAHAGLSFCYQDPDNNYVAMISAAGDEFQLVRQVGDIETILARHPADIVEGVSYRLEATCDGTRVSAAVVHGSTIVAEASVADASFERGRIGPHVYAVRARTFELGAATTSRPGG